MHPVTLFHLAPSHHCERARKVLDLKGIPYELEPVPYQDHSALIEATGQDYAPAIKTAKDEVVTWQGIADWAEARVPEPTLYPVGSRGLCRILVHWCYTVVEERTWRYAVPQAPAMFPDAAERWRFVEFQERKYGDLDVLGERQEHHLAGVEEVCQLAQDQLADQPFLLGEAPSLADCALYGGLHPLYFVEAGLPEGFEKLAAWRERVDDF